MKQNIYPKTSLSYFCFCINNSLHETCPEVCLRYTVTFHWGILLFPLPIDTITKSFLGMVSPLSVVLPCLA